MRLLRPAEAPPPLTWTDRKAELLAALGVDAVIAYPTDEELLRLAPDDFFQRVVRDQLDARAMVEGPNFYFGRGRSGTIDVLRRLTSAAGIRLEVVEPLVVGGEYVSSSRIRRLLSEGRVELARELLTEPYRIRGMVVHGAGRGAKLGFGTANLDAVDTLLPGPGVYAGRGFVNHPNPSRWPAAINIGPNPTFGEHAMKVEVHLAGWDGSPLYGQPLEVDFLAPLRPVRRFSGVEELKQQLHDDVLAARRAFQDYELADKLRAKRPRAVSPPDATRTRQRYYCPSEITARQRENYADSLASIRGVGPFARSVSVDQPRAARLRRPGQRIGDGRSAGSAP